MIIFGVFQQRKETFAQYSHNNDTWRHLKRQKVSKKRARNKINGLKINFICVYFEIITESVSATMIRNIIIINITKMLIIETNE